MNTNKQNFSFQLLLAIIFVLILFSCNENKPKPTPPKPVVTEPKVEKPKPAIVYDYDTTQWTDVAFLDSTIIIDMRYATTNNFVKEKMYNCGRCFLRPDVAKALLQAHRQLQKKGLGLKMFDCYRPLPVQQLLWDKFKNPSYVTPPSKGSMHNRGAATDLTIVDINGKELEMGTEFDFFGKKAHHTFTDLPNNVLTNRKLLKETMESLGFGSIRTEWWHYSYRKGNFELSEMIWKCKE